MTGIAEMFAELGGGERYWTAVAVFMKRDRARLAANNRAFRERQRAKLGIAPRVRPVAQHGTFYFYTKRKCRCSDCRAASAAYMRARRARLKEAA